MAATPTPMPAPVIVLAMLATAVIYAPVVPPISPPNWAIIVPTRRVENKPSAIPLSPSINISWKNFLIDMFFICLV